MKKIATIIFLVLTIFLSSATIAEGEGQIDIRRFSLQNTHLLYQYKVNANIQIILSEPLRIALLNGIKLNMKITFSLGEHSAWWWDSQETIQQLLYEIKYHSLSKYYTITNRITNQFWNFSTLPRALRHIGTIHNFLLPTLSNEIADGRHYLFIKATIQPITPTLPLKIQSLFNNPYIIKSEGILWALP